MANSYSPMPMNPAPCGSLFNPFNHSFVFMRHPSRKKDHHHQSQLHPRRPSSLKKKKRKKRRRRKPVIYIWSQTLFSDGTENWFHVRRKLTTKEKGESDSAVYWLSTTTTMVPLFTVSVISVSHTNLLAKTQKSDVEKHRYEHYSYLKVTCKWS